MPPEPTDDALARALAGGDEEALRALHRRYAPLVFTLAARAIGEAAADEVVQDVFLAAWQKRAAYDPARGTFKGWIVHAARNRVLNELRRRATKRGSADDLELLPDTTPEPDEQLWLARRRLAIRTAVEALPPAQRQALSLAFFDELTNAQVASFLEVPLGTAKTRIRLGLRHLAGVLLASAVVVAALWVRRLDAEREREDRALRMVTASDVVPLRLVAVGDIPLAAHGTYRARIGSNVAVLTTTSLPPRARGDDYQAWVSYDGRWTWLGAVHPAADGRAVVVAEIAPPRAAPQVVRVTREASSDHEAPRGPVIIEWTATSGN